MNNSQPSTSDPYVRLPGVFGRLLALECLRRQITETDFARAAGLLDSTAVIEMEQGTVEPTLTQFFRIAEVIGKAPSMLMIDLIAAWRSEPAGRSHRSRPHDFARLYRLGCFHKPGDFRELGSAFPSLDRASRAVERFNVRRLARRVPLIDTISVYVRLDSLRLKSPIPATTRCLEGEV